MVHFSVLRILAILSLFLIPVTLFSQPDETMPSSIPDEIVSDWKKQDGNKSAADIKKELEEDGYEEYAAKIEGNDYLTACHWRRVARLSRYMEDMNKILYAKHFNFGGGIVGSLEGTPGAQGSNWKVGSGFYTLNMDNYYPEPEVLLEDNAGVVKDPCVSFDGSYVIFSWWKKSDGGGFHIYELDLETKKTRQITDNPVGLTVGDYEPCILPTGDILFNSSRVFGTIDCAYSVVSNLYMCNKNGDWLRRIGFDQEHTFSPTMMEDGLVLYTRWEYNDRSRISCGAYFVMNPDGTRQTEYWGNQSDFPVMKYQGRQIPRGDGKIMGIAGGHIAPYQGEIVVCDPLVDRNRWPGHDNESVKMFLDGDETPMDPSDAMQNTLCGVDFTYQNPWPLSSKTCLVSWGPKGRDDRFRIFFLKSDGSRELIAWDDRMSVSQPVVMDARDVPPLVNIQADYTKKTGIFSVANVNLGMGSEGVPEGTIKRLRVLSIGPYRTNFYGNRGILGFSIVPIGAANTSWQVKTHIGEVDVESDGSACFEVPANTPIYFQTLDEDGRMINTMRSWSTLMPGERFDCLGCHENKNEAPPTDLGSVIATTPKPLEKNPLIADVHLSFPKHVQPILDARCVECHSAGHKSGLDLRANPTYDNRGERTFNASYTKLTSRQGKYVDWITQYEKAAPRTKFPVPGSGTSPLAERLLGKHRPDDLTDDELNVIFTWIDMMAPHAGAYSEGRSASDSAAHDEYMAEHRLKHAAWEAENIEDFIAAGQWANEIYTGVGVAQPKYSHATKMRKDAAGELQVIPLEGKLVVRCPGAGVISLLDMKGRLLKKVNVTDMVKNGKAQMPVSRIIPFGIYIVRFESKDIVRQRVVSIM
jgi:hypothetical protein